MHTPRICAIAWQPYGVWAAALGHRPVNVAEAKNAHAAYIEHREHCKDCDRVMQK